MTTVCLTLALLHTEVTGKWLDHLLCTALSTCILFNRKKGFLVEVCASVKDMLFENDGF